MMNGGGGAAGDGESVRNKADEEVDRILREQYDRGMDLLTEHRDILDTIAKTLIDNEKISGEELLKVIQEKNPQLVTQDQIETVLALSSKPKKRRSKGGKTCRGMKK